MVVQMLNSLHYPDAIGIHCAFIRCDATVSPKACGVMAFYGGQGVSRKSGTSRQLLRTKEREDVGIRHHALSLIQGFKF